MSQPQFADQLLEILFSQDQLALLTCIQLKNNAGNLKLNNQHLKLLLEFIPSIREYVDFIVKMVNGQSIVVTELFAILERNPDKSEMA